MAEITGKRAKAIRTRIKKLQDEDQRRSDEISGKVGALFDSLHFGRTFSSEAEKDRFIAKEEIKESAAATRKAETTSRRRRTRRQTPR